MPVALTIVVKKRVKIVKLKTKPVTMPKGRRRPSPTDPARTIGRTGRMQGDRMVTTPAKKAKTISKSIVYRLIS